MEELRLFKVTIEVTVLSSAKEALQVVVDRLVGVPSIKKIKPLCCIETKEKRE